MVVHIFVSNNQEVGCAYSAAHFALTLTWVLSRFLEVETRFQPFSNCIKHTMTERGMNKERPHRASWKVVGAGVNQLHLRKSPMWFFCVFCLFVLSLLFIKTIRLRSDEVLLGSFCRWTYSLSYWRQARLRVYSADAIYVLKSV